MRLLKVLVVIAGLFALARYFPPVYYATQFNDFVRQEIKRTTAAAPLRQQLLSKADLYFLPVKPEDIQISESGSVVRVNVDYQVPVDLFVFTHVLSFHATASGVALAAQ